MGSYCTVGTVEYYRPGTVGTYRDKQFSVQR